MPFPLIAAAIGAGASLLGGALNRRAQARENELNRQRQDDQLQRMMVDAGLAGIHPIAAMGMGGNYGSPVGPAPSMGDEIAQAGGAVSDVMLAQQDFQISAQNLELERMRLENDMRMFELAEAQSRSVLNALRQGAADRAPAIVAEASPALLGGTPFEIGGAGPYTPARVAEDAYGELGEWVFGVPNLIRDLAADMGITVTGDRLWPGEIGTVTFGSPGRRRPAMFSTTPGVNMETDRLWRLSHP